MKTPLNEHKEGMSLGPALGHSNGLTICMTSVSESVDIQQPLPRMMRLVLQTNKCSS
jgi:hypothetical protein